MKYGQQYSKLSSDGTIVSDEDIANMPEGETISVTRKDIIDKGYKIEVLIGKSASSTNGGIIAQIHEETEESTPKTETYTLSYDVHIDGLEVPETQQIEKDTEASISFLPQPERNGYDFLGWSDNKEDLDGKFKVVGSKILMDSNKTLYAIWGLQNQLPAGTIALTESRADNDVKNYEYADTTSLYTEAQYNTHYNEGVQAGLNQTTGNAQPSDIKSGKTAWVNGSQITGTYTAPTLASQTPGTAEASDIAQGKTAWVDGSQITGTMTSSGGSGGSSGIGSVGNVLWTNPNPTSNFNADQTITLSEPLTNYNYFIIEWYFIKTDTTSYYSDLFEVGRYAENNKPMYSIACQKGGYIYCRRFFTTSDTSLSNGSAVKQFASNSSDNSLCIPYRIKGLNLTF